jgi:hypothetical protein
MKYFLILILLITGITTAIAQKVKPALNLVNGNTYYMVSNVNSVIMQTINGRENPINLNVMFKMAFKVTGVTDTLYNMEVSYQTLDMKIQTAGTTIEMNSQKTDGNDIPSKIVAAMVNKPFNITITKSGKIKSVDNVENMISGVFDSFTQIDSVKRQQIKSQFMQSFGAKAFKGNLEIATAIFPEKKVSVNDTWVVNTKLESTMTAMLKTTYQLTGITDKSYQIHGAGSIFTDNSAPATMISGFPMKYSLTGTLTSDIVADKATGWISNLKLNEVMKGNVIIQDNKQMPGGMTIPMTITSDQVMTNN